jgi:hypothetical protein
MQQLLMTACVVEHLALERRSAADARKAQRCRL